MKSSLASEEPLQVGLYVHVPFCRRKCRYCDFYSRPPKAGEFDRFVAAVLREGEMRREGVRLCAQANTSAGLGTVYFGGGTPSMVGAGRLARVLDEVRRAWGIADDAEITIEANPLDVTAEWARGALDAGFDRISIGVQSTVEDDLRFLGRPHRAADGPRAVAVAREAGFREIGIDLIYGLPGQTPSLLAEQIGHAVETCRPEHVSCYQLTYATGTPIRADLDAGRISRLSEDREYGLFVCVHRTLAELGYPAYEVSNFSLNGRHRSRHNGSYWGHAPYVGLGPAAHSFLPPVRSWNVRSISDYLARVEAGEPPTDGSEELSAQQLAAEAVLLALRTTDGLDRARYRERFGRDLLDTHRDAIKKAVESGRLTVSSSRLRPTLDGLALADILADALTA